MGYVTLLKTVHCKNSNTRMYCVLSIFLVTDYGTYSYAICRVQRTMCTTHVVYVNTPLLCDSLQLKYCITLTKIVGWNNLTQSSCVTSSIYLLMLLHAITTSCNKLNVSNYTYPVRYQVHLSLVRYTPYTFVNTNYTREYIQAK